MKRDKTADVLLAHKRESSCEEWMNRPSAALFALLAMMSLKAAAQTSNLPRPVRVSVCDLLAEPSKYDGELVRVRGQVSIAFEDFSLFDNGCPRPEEPREAIGVWLNYGGDESAPTVYCCGDHSRKPGEVVELRGRPTHAKIALTIPVKD